MQYKQLRETELMRQLAMMTVIGTLALLLLLTSVLLFGPESQAFPRLRGNYFATACQHPNWVEEKVDTEYEFEPISPTPAPEQQSNVANKYKRTTPLVVYDSPPVTLPEPYTLRWRMGIGIPEKNPLYFQWPQSRPGWYLNWTTGYRETRRLGGLLHAVQMNQPDETTLGMSFVPMVRVPKGELRPPPEALMALATKNPGRTWLIGNEPDVEWQDNATPEQYAYAYRCAHAAIKSGDPTATVAFAGLSQITPLRIQYLDRIWSFYRSAFGQEMPVDLWNMHAFVLREEAESWGVRIPPGLEAIPHGYLWEIEDHARLDLVEEQIRLMRGWMKEHGQQEKPLIISEYGILLPEDYGFSIPDVVRFMWGSFDLFQSLQDSELGYPEDDFRLVQRWVWFSTRYDLYPTGDLFNLDDTPGPLLRAMNMYMEQNQ
ncbi:MAG: hypothetical protein AAF702_07760 [Chloroflexota bacterium]